LLHVCELIHANLFPDQEGQQRPFASLEEDDTRLSRIFERFVRNFFRREQSDYVVSAENIMWDVADRGGKECDLLPIMRTDVTLRNAHRTIIIDAKYYGQTLQTHFDNESIRSGHLYQLFAYLKNLERNGGPDLKAEGVLLYPKVQRDIDFKVLIQGHFMRVKTLDLVRSWEDIRRDMTTLIGLRANDSETQCVRRV
jgi:5-methylcytosine-specific restriction enzyme subunit McrC